MKVSLATHGGQQAGVNMRASQQVVDSGSLSGAAAKELADLVAAAKLAPGGSRSELARELRNWIRAHSTRH
jgi:hypothetical protein